jgi:hypothetical protein
VRSARSKSDDLPYTGPVVEVPEQPPDRLDEHGVPVATQDQGKSYQPDPGSPDWHRKLADWRRKWIADGEKPEDVDDAVRATIREEIDDPSQVEIEFARVMALAV